MPAKPIRPLSGNYQPQTPPGAEQKIDSLLAELTLEQKIGQLLTFEFCGTRITPDVIRAVQKYHCGGLRLTPHIYTALPYGWRHKVQGITTQRLSPYAGPEEYAGLLNELQRMAAERSGGIPLHLSIDQEGDFSQDYARGGVNLFPSPMGMAATGDPELVYESYKAVAKQLRAAGITMIHTPCLDVNTNPKNPEIGTRSFSDDPVIAAEYALQQFYGFRDGGLVATGKHFPGRGESAVDVHFSLDTFNGDRKRLEKVELYPYKKLIEAGLPAVMTAHTVYPALDDSGAPASVSRKIVTGLLREELGFQGVITTDAMGMKGVIDLFDDFGEACAAAIAAGNDLVLAKGDPELQPTVIAAVKRYLEEGKITEDQIEASVRRILKMKFEYGLFDNRYADPARAMATIRSPRIIDLSKTAAESCLTLVRDEQDILPLSKDTKIFVTDQHNWPYYNKAADYYHHSHMLPEFLRNKAADPLLIDDWETELIPTEEDEKECLARAEKADAIVVLTFFWRSSGVNTGLLRKLIATGKPVITISNCPYDHVSIDEAGTLVLTYSCTPRSLEAAVKLIYGDIEPPEVHWPLSSYKMEGIK